MPHFSKCCSVDEYICQKCGRIYCSKCDPSSWMKAVTKNEHAGNVCPKCVEKHTDWTIKKDSFYKVMYSITTENINKLETRNMCPCCESPYNMKNLITSTGEKWLFQCTTCSIVIEVVK